MLDDRGTSGETPMTEAEWLTCTDPRMMLAFLQGKTSQRKLRLFVCACCRRIWQLLNDQQNRAAVEMAERFADGGISYEQLEEAAAQAATPPYAQDATYAVQGATALGYIAQLVCVTANSASWSAANVAAIHGMSTGRTTSWDQARSAERAEQCRLLWDVTGRLPFKRVLLDPFWLTWNDALVVRLAQGAYEERHLPDGTLDKSRLAILADALEEAGCTDAEILDHLRVPAPHVRGCWAVDLILGKS
jgi:hypothetical protein